MRATHRHFSNHQHSSLRASCEMEKDILKSGSMHLLDPDNEETDYSDAY